MTAAWPLELRGVTESVVATQGPNDRWNLAVLGLHAPKDADDDEEGASPVTARTWGDTRTRRNFTERGRGHVQFTRDPVDFVEAALGIVEQDDPALASANARVEVSVERLDDGESGGTTWVDWAITPVEATVERRVVPATSRGFNAVVEGTVAASRLDVDAYDAETLRARLSYFESIVDRCGGTGERDAWKRLQELADAEW